MLTQTLEINRTLKNSELCEIFKCSTQGGMRRSHRTNTLVIVSNHYKSIYGDRWLDETLHYTGMGLKGDQSLMFSQNRTLAESHKNEIGVHLFEVFGPKGGYYHYRGEVSLVGEPYQEQQLDVKGNLRSVWIFPLRPIDETNSHTVDIEDIERVLLRHEAKAVKLSTAALLKRAKTSPKKTGMYKTVRETRARNQYVAEYARRRAAGVCELCNLEAPFEKKSGAPFLEVHHVVWLSRGGEDSVENVVALCPNCHRKMHILDDERDKVILKGKRQNETLA